MPVTLVAEELDIDFAQFDPIEGSYAGTSLAEAESSLDNAGDSKKQEEQAQNSMSPQPDHSTSSASNEYRQSHPSPCSVRTTSPRKVVRFESDRWAGEEDSYSSFRSTPRSEAVPGSSSHPTGDHPDNATSPGESSGTRPETPWIIGVTPKSGEKFWGPWIDDGTFTIAPVLSPHVNEQAIIPIRQIDRLKAPSSETLMNQLRIASTILEAQTENQKSMFMRLPQEIRDQILKDAVTDELSSDAESSTTSRSLLLASRGLFGNTTRVLLEEREFAFNVRSHWLTIRFACNDNTNRVSYDELVDSYNLDEHLNPLEETGEPFLIRKLKLAETRKPPFDMIRHVKLIFGGRFSLYSPAMTSQCYSMRLDPFFGLVILASMEMRSLRNIRLHFIQPHPDHPTPASLRMWMAARIEETATLMLQGIDCTQFGIKITATESDNEIPFFEREYHEQPEDVDVVVPAEEHTLPDGTYWEYRDRIED
ncbi:hypothetical protein NA57DRAFT_73398 [Rhizodiscina lignyota]|uniref:Uncharacterized protein n=1 Tax=Rhizodiscina lignyota TaxID=1504668 RepID=A0A9P4IM62_9PEZI|nr:hypothetical protein NA57DRAFT_73398 [Rhizodiscina lignyota]